ncbi:MAG: hypothetical protein NZ954_08235 [Thermofilaceae archaeon]|nr:hypothetical protein [Thermofilaceae archaeon]MDW8004919.1 hypothetical protein [Thermofilaceae archaeon]
MDLIAVLILWLLALITVALTYPLIVYFYVLTRDIMIPTLLDLTGASMPPFLKDLMPLVEAAIWWYPYITVTILTIWVLMTMFRYSVEGREYRV